jgi:Flp pilus assembly protein CpaB
MKSRLIVLALAVVLGVVAALVTANYLRGASAKLTAEAEPVQVMVATQDIGRGTTAEVMIESGAIELREIPRRYVADGAVSSPSMITGKVLSVPLTTGEQVTAARFRYPSEVGLSYGIPDGFVAMSIAANDVKCVGGMLKPGDWVMVTVTFDPGPTDPETADDEEAPPPEAITRILLPKVKVLAVGQTTDPEPAQTTTTQTGGGGVLGGGTAQTEQRVSNTITLALLPEDLEKLVFSEEKGSVWLALLPATETAVPETAGRTLQSIFE